MLQKASCLTTGGLTKILLTLYGRMFHDAKSETTCLIFFYFFSKNSSDMIFQNIISRMSHCSMTVSIYLIEISVRMAYQFQHSPKIGIFFITSEEFQTSITGNLDDRWCILPYMKEWGIFMTGKTPLEFIRILRLKRGKQLIDQSGENISQIAWQIGLSPKQFSKYFKEEYGCLPSEYKANR